ncbi:hypothetical protein TB2_015123 [Malus domestica]
MQSEITQESSEEIQPAQITQELPKEMHRQPEMTQELPEEMHRQLEITQESPGRAWLGAPLRRFSNQEPVDVSTDSKREESMAASLIFIFGKSVIMFLSHNYAPSHALPGDSWVISGCPRLPKNRQRRCSVSPRLPKNRPAEHGSERH